VQLNAAQAEIKREEHADRHTDIQMHRNADRHAYRQTDTRTDMSIHTLAVCEREVEGQTHAHKAMREEDDPQMKSESLQNEVDSQMKNESLQKALEAQESSLIVSSTSQKRPMYFKETYVCKKETYVFQKRPMR